jgi:hypothetical protein
MVMLFLNSSLGPAANSRQAEARSGGALPVEYPAKYRTFIPISSLERRRGGRKTSEKGISSWIPSSGIQK